MKVHTTNYTNTFIEIADDCPATAGTIPPIKGDTRTIANIQFDILANHPYEYTSDDVLFKAYAEKNGLKGSQLKTAREEFFSKGQPCLRCSPLTKRYGWGVHANEKGKIALYGCETKEYVKLLKDKDLATVKAMKTKR